MCLNIKLIFQYDNKLSPIENQIIKTAFNKIKPKMIKIIEKKIWDEIIGSKQLKGDKNGRKI